MTARRAAARYGEALFGLAQERNAVASVRRELRELAALVDASPDLQQLLARPDVDPERKLEALRSALGPGFTDTLVGLLTVLVRHGRGQEVAEVAEAFEQFADEAAGVVRAEARTVVPLTQQQRGRLVGALERVTGRRVILREEIDLGVLAGVRLQVGDRLVDGSAAGRLEHMRQELIKP